MGHIPFSAIADTSGTTRVYRPLVNHDVLPSGLAQENYGTA